jgi:hypothetical protein
MDAALTGLAEVIVKPGVCVTATVIVLGIICAGVGSKVTLSDDILGAAGCDLDSDTCVAIRVITQDVVVSARSAKRLIPFGAAVIHPGEAESR